MKNMAAKDNDGSVPKPKKGTIGLHEEKIISENRISVSNADEGDLITEIEISRNCQLAVMGSKVFRMPDSELFGGDRKKDHRKVIKDKLRPEAMVRIPEVPT